jgi:hypothetical protein
VVTITVLLPPAAPTGVKVVDSLPTSKMESFRAYWNAVAGATRYEMQRRDTSELIYSGTLLNYLIAGGPTGFRPPYTIVNVRACNAAGCSAWVASTMVRDF